MTKLLEDNAVRKRCAGVPSCALLAESHRKRGAWCSRQGGAVVQVTAQRPLALCSNATQCMQCLPCLQCHFVLLPTEYRTMSTLSLLVHSRKEPVSVAGDAAGAGRALRHRRRLGDGAGLLGRDLPHRCQVAKRDHEESVSPFPALPNTSSPFCTILCDRHVFAAGAFLPISPTDFKKPGLVSTKQFQTS